MPSCIMEQVVYARNKTGYSTLLTYFVQDALIKRAIVEFIRTISDQILHRLHSKGSRRFYGRVVYISEVYMLPLEAEVVML